MAVRLRAGFLLSVSHTVGNRYVYVYRVEIFNQLIRYIHTCGVNKAVYTHDLLPTLQIVVDNGLSGSYSLL